MASSRTASRPAAFGQRSFDDLGTPLRDVTFCVIDLETTGTSPDTCAITEVGAVRLRAGECLGTFQTLVNPGSGIPRSITVLTGITEAMVLPAPRIEGVLPALLEFIGGSVIVGHNVRFDIAFLDAALLRSGRPPLGATRIDTVALARRLVRDEVPDCRLGTLAARFRLDHRPSHRALDDALATADLLHALLERAAAYGVVGLDDLVTLPTMGAHPQAAKLRLTTALPRAPGVYIFRGRASGAAGREGADTTAGGVPLYVGKATDLRSRVRSYFSTDDRRQIGPMLRAAEHVEHIACSSTLEAAVLEARLLGRWRPHYNKVGTRWDRAAYVRLTAEPYPRLTVGRSPGAGAPLVLGPLPSTRVARAVASAIEAASPVRPCTARARPGVALRAAPCAPAQLGVAACPCTGDVAVAAYARTVERIIRGTGPEPGLLLQPLAERMHALAATERYEEAAEARDQAAAFAAAIRRQRRLDLWRRSGRVVLELPGGAGAELQGGLLVRAWGRGELGFGRAGIDAPVDDLARSATAEVAAEVLVVASWLDANARRTRIDHADGALSCALPRLPTFVPAR